MPIKQTFNYTSANGSPHIEFHEWAKTSLSTDEYNRWETSVERQSALRQDAIDAGHMIYDKESEAYIWDEAWAEGKNPQELKDWDDEWLEFFNRYLDETKQELTTIEEKI